MTSQEGWEVQPICGSWNGKLWQESRQRRTPSAALVFLHFDFVSLFALSSAPHACCFEAFCLCHRFPKDEGGVRYSRLISGMALKFC